MKIKDRKILSKKDSIKRCSDILSWFLSIKSIGFLKFFSIAYFPNFWLRNINLCPTLGFNSNDCNFVFIWLFYCKYLSNQWSDRSKVLCQNFNRMNPFKWRMGVGNFIDNSKGIINDKAIKNSTKNVMSMICSILCGYQQIKYKF